MSKIKFHIQFKKHGDWDFEIVNKEAFKEIAIDKYVHSDIEGFTLDCEGKLLSGAKTLSQLGYLHAEVLYKALLGYQAFGWNINTTEQAKFLLKEQIGFHEEIQHPNANYKQLRPRSFSEATKEETRLFIDEAIIFIQTELCMKVEDPETYKKRMGIKKFIR